MSRVTIELPDSLAQRLEEAARKEGITLDQLLSSAAAEKLSAWLTIDYLRQRAANARREDFVQFLDMSPDVLSLPGGK
ncbi:MAG: toxin-antitoxin system HicB family antitoxin [Candidatus Hydrogenedentes bacterium]|nr:toxin-antitoxin system HicB family antitoxin [Candidatus Hydrogenedentota bacterium]